MRRSGSLITLVTCAALAGLAAPAAATTADAPPTTAEGVEWIVGSADTLGDVVERASASQDDAAVAAALHAMSARAESGQAVDFPGLDTAATVTVADVTDAAADALLSGAEMPAAVESFDLSPDAGRVLTRPNADRPAKGSDDDISTMGYITNQGYAYVQDNWIRRGLMTTSGTVNWTDKLTMTWVTTPSIKSSRHTITMRYFPSTGFFSRLWVDLDAYTGTNVYLGTLSSTKRSLPLNGTETKYTYYASRSGKNLFHVAVLVATMRTGGESRDGQRTPVAGCYTNSTSCKY